MNTGFGSKYNFIHYAKICIILNFLFEKQARFTKEER